MVAKLDEFPRLGYPVGIRKFMCTILARSLQSAVLQRTAAQRDRWRAEITVDGVPDYVYLLLKCKSVHGTSNTVVRILRSLRTVLYVERTRLGQYRTDSLYY